MEMLAQAVTLYEILICLTPRDVRCVQMCVFIEKGAEKLIAFRWVSSKNLFISYFSVHAPQVADS